MRLALLTALVLASFTAMADEIQLQDNAPDRHTVVKGDTLWGISERFLKNPWKWPEVWRLNREEIKNPHLIYPGDTVRLMRGAQPQLVLERDALETVKLSPQARAEPIEEKAAAIPSIPYEAIASLLNQGGLVNDTELASAPRILGSSEGRVLYGAGDRVYATANDTSVPRWEIVRAGPAVIDPDSGETLGNLLIHVGMMHMIEPGQPALFEIDKTSQEVLERDRLYPHFGNSDLAFAPHAPDKPITAKVAATLSGAKLTGTYSSLVLNKGSRDGLEVGHVLGVYRAAPSIADPRCLRAEKLAFIAGRKNAKDECSKYDENGQSIPDKRIAVAFVYRVFERAAYALVLKGEQPVAIKDAVRNP